MFAKRWDDDRIEFSLGFRVRRQVKHDRIGQADAVHRKDPSGATNLAPLASQAASGAGGPRLDQSAKRLRQQGAGIARFFSLAAVDGRDLEERIAHALQLAKAALAPRVARFDEAGVLSAVLGVNFEGRQGATRSDKERGPTSSGTWRCWLLRSRSRRTQEAQDCGRQHSI